jgi:CheY-like chemotaxis protein
MAKILVVEDEKNARTAIVTYFRELGFTVESAANTAEAIKLAKSFAPLILITDWILENQDKGTAIAKTLYMDNSDLKIIFISGYSLDRLRKQCHDIPVNAFLAKPVSLSELNAVVHQALKPG